MVNNFIKLYVLRNTVDPRLVRLDIKNPSITGYIVEKEMYVLNPLLFPPHMNGTSLICIVNSRTHPYHTVWIHDSMEYTVDAYNDILNRSTGSSSIYYDYINVCVFMRKTSPLAQSFLWQNLPGYLHHIPHRPSDSPYQIFFYHDKPHLFWECNSECACIPSDNPSMYTTLQACNVHCFNNNRDKKVYIGSSQNMLYAILENYNRQTGRGQNILTSRPAPTKEPNNI